MLHWANPRAAHPTTYSRILGRVIEIAEFEQVVRDYFANQANAGESVLLNLDGKTLRGTIPAGQTRGVHLLAAYLPEEGWVLAQVKVESKENEIPASARLLKALDLQGTDVLDCQELIERFKRIFNGWGLHPKNKHLSIPLCPSHSGWSLHSNCRS